MSNRRRKQQIGLAIIVAVGIFAIAVALWDTRDRVLAPLIDFFGPPPPGDPSALTGPFIGLEFARDLIATLLPANEGAFEGGATGTPEDAAEDNIIPPGTQSLGGRFNIPTGAPPSPLFGAEPFTQQMLRHEEFGVEPLGTTAAPNPIPFPRPSTGPLPEQDPNDVSASGPSGVAIEAFLSQAGISPFPTEFSNQAADNPWRPDIEAFLGRPLDTPPAEGRPPGRGWAHQRWNEFFPQVFFQTAQVGARTNLGFRDRRQRHGFAVGEFGPGGLYHNVTGRPGAEGTLRGVEPRFHPLMPVQEHNSLWTFDGTLPPKILKVRYGQGILMRHYNALPIDPSANRGFGLHTISTHEHNGHQPAESDGFTNAFFFPGQFSDYRWPIQLAGYDTVNTTASDPRAAFPCDPGESLFVNDLAMSLKSCDDGRIQIRGDFRETMSTHFFHDHMLDFTAQNVYKGNAAVMNYYSALDRGNEARDDGINLRFPSGSALGWGNLDYDVNLMVFDKAWDDEGQLLFNIFNLDGFLGDRMMVNWLYKPYFHVRSRRYRFRLLNASVSRYFAFALVQEIDGSAGELPGPPGSGKSFNRIPFHMIANDGNIMQHAIPFDGSIDLDRDGELDDHKGVLPTQGIAERYDIIVDFAQHGLEPGDRLLFLNLVEHTGGRKPDDKIPLEAVLSGEYKAVIRDDRWIDGDPAVGPFLQLRVVAYDGVDQSMNPEDFEPGGRTMIPLPLNRDDPQLLTAIRRDFEFGRSNGSDETPWTIKTDGGVGFAMDPRRLTAAPRLAVGPQAAGFDGTNAAGDDVTGQLEIWSLRNGGNGWSHPIHIHFEEGIILKRDGEDPPLWEMFARKDIFRIGPLEDSGQSVEVALRFREFAGSYMEHCHNTQHEDHAMLLRWDIERPGQVQIMPAPIPTWDGVEYVDSYATDTFRTGDGQGPSFARNAGQSPAEGQGEQQ